jgi:capsular polysaccharide biosynthesis protein
MLLIRNQEGFSMKSKLSILMKNEVLSLIIGILIGAIVTTTIFLVIKSNDKSNVSNMNNMPISKNGMNNGDKSNNDNINEESDSGIESDEE